MDDKKHMIIKKLNEDDILEILLEYYQDKECAYFPNSKGMLLGISGEDLRFIGIYGKAVRLNPLSYTYDGANRLCWRIR